MEKNQLAIYGAGGFGREVAWLAQSIYDSNHSWDIVCFIDDEIKEHDLNAIPVISLTETISKFSQAKIVSGVGLPQLRELTMNKAAAAGFGFTVLIHPRVEISEWIDIGEGTIICAGNILTTNITLGKHVQINLDCTIGHDVVMQDYSTLAPGVHVSGYVHIGKRAYIGTGAVIINGTKENPLTIGDDAIIGAGACVTQSIPAGVTWGGVPAKPLHKRIGFERRSARRTIGVEALARPSPDRNIACGVSTSVHRVQYAEGAEAHWLQPEDAEWEDALQQCAHDVYHTSAYVMLEARRMRGTAAAILMKADGLIGLVPIVVRQLPNQLGSDFNSFLDATSPYGYPGPVWGGGEGVRSPKIPAALQAMSQLLAERDVCSMFLRMHTLLPTPEIEESATVHVVNHGQTVWMDLTMDDITFRRTIRENHRRAIQRMNKQGYTVQIDAHWERLRDFISLYYETMVDVGAEAEYFFTPQYFFDLRDTMRSCALLVFVMSGNEVISGGIFFTLGGIVQYHLGGTFRKYRELSPSSFMFDFVRRWAAKRGNLQFHLGGGVGGEMKDSLFHFKAGFSQHRSMFKTWRIIILPSLYERAVARWRECTKISSEGEPFFPLYRKRF
jgi:sugar O-acyltransferase (sialic acid O-acetyltransferase NeuD family)